MTIWQQQVWLWVGVVIFIISWSYPLLEWAIKRKAPFKTRKMAFLYYARGLVSAVGWPVVLASLIVILIMAALDLVWRFVRSRISEFMIHGSWWKV